MRRLRILLAATLAICAASSSVHAHTKPATAKPADVTSAQQGPSAIRAQQSANAPIAGAPTTNFSRERRACQAGAKAAWRAQGLRFSIDAQAHGPTCLTAVSTLVVRDAEGGVLWLDSIVNEQNFIFQDADTPTKLAKALGDWIDQRDPVAKTTADLPAWPADAELPSSGEFAFYPEEIFGNREAWERMRRQGAPLICYVQGMESMACIARIEGQFEKIGAQTFPG